VLLNLGVKLEEVREEVLEFLGADVQPEQPSSEEEPDQGNVPGTNGGGSNGGGNGEGGNGPKSRRRR
jgi:hypothetical protein